MNPLLDRLLKEENNLIYFPEQKIGFFDVDRYMQDKPHVYDKDYFLKYKGYEDSERGVAITKARCDFVRKNVVGDVSLLDVGIGSGDFIKAFSEAAKGTDINPYAIEWMKSEGRWDDRETYDVVTFFDSLEHFKDFSHMLKRTNRYIFVSIPVFDNAEEILNSKHYRKDEHFWYVSKSSFVSIMKDYGFMLIDISEFEIELGREGIVSFGFEKINS